jgi:transposase
VFLVKIQDQVLNVWRTPSRSERRLVRSRAKHSCDPHLRNHCKLVLSLVGGNGARAIAKAGLCSISQVYRVAHQIVECGPAGLADRREDNGETKADEYFQAIILEVVGESSPRKQDYRCSTWTQELLVLVVELQTGIRISRTTMCRVLKRLKIPLGRPKPIVG